jgi:hypothetical protein
VVMKSIIFCDMTPCSLLSCNRLFGGTYHLHLQGRRYNFGKNHQISRWQAEYSAEIISSTLKMEAICSSETSAETQQTTRRHIPEDDTRLIPLLYFSWDLLYPGVNRPGREADHSPPTSTEVKKTLIYTSAPPYPSMA